VFAAALPASKIDRAISSRRCSSWKLSSCAMISDPVGSTGGGKNEPR